ncbi:hypothetical protein ISS05_00840 [Candidatus Woesearchaeota archaeon]|nr:hypothetical protein [Candidatus Woesearchaeota archaeon]
MKRKYVFEFLGKLLHNLIIITLLLGGFILLFTPLINHFVDLDGYSLMQANKFCKGWVGQIAIPFSEEVRSGCSYIEAGFYISIGAIILGISLFLMDIFHEKP